MSACNIKVNEASEPGKSFLSVLSTDTRIPYKICPEFKDNENSMTLDELQIATAIAEIDERLEKRESLTNNQIILGTAPLECLH